MYIYISRDTPVDHLSYGLNAAYQRPHCVLDSDHLNTTGYRQTHRRLIPGAKKAARLPFLRID
ncbi:hypothetical protein [Solemya velum gill symbiont]|uniref:hypothetical protein n=1 Tax=Solemya velum gill symbiont TaxID=2340 RepID=UPI000997B7A6|nr:hypothetical protein [Solemya velum gill symbiont]